jgi:large subunit ribosomal protein L9
MKVILVKDVPNLGEEGDVCDVADGYARNYLLPKQFAVLHNKHTQDIMEQKRSAIEKRKEEKRKEAQTLKERLEGEEMVLHMQAGETDKLFGSVNNATIAEQLEKQGINIERKRINIPQNTIKELGEYDIEIKLYNDEIAHMKVIVKRPEEE